MLDHIPHGPIHNLNNIFIVPCSKLWSMASVCFLCSGCRSSACHFCLVHGLTFLSKCHLNHLWLTATPLDYCIVKLCRLCKTNALRSLLLLSSSYVMLAYQCHSFSNSIEAVVLALSITLLFLSHPPDSQQQAPVCINLWHMNYFQDPHSYLLFHSYLWNFSRSLPFVWASHLLLVYLPESPLFCLAHQLDVLIFTWHGKERQELG